MLSRDDSWCQDGLNRRYQVCGTCGMVNVTTGPVRHLEQLGDRFAEQHADCTGEHPRLVGMKERREAVLAAKRNAPEAEEAPVADSPRQQAFAEVFGTAR